MRRLSFGALECRVVPDGVGSYNKETMYSDVPAELLAASLQGVLNDEGFLPLPYHPLLIQTDDHVVLVDAGAGAELAKEWGEPVGRLRNALRAADVQADEVGLVLISHAHPDHVGGLTEGDGDGRRPVFTNARHVISRTELGYWASDRVPNEFASMAALARLHLTPLEQAGMLDQIDGETELVPGIQVIPAPGHTPGHLAVVISAGSDTGMFVADAVLGETNFEHPEWSSRLESDRQGAVETRRRLLDRAAADRCTVFGYHLWKPGVVERDGRRYRWSPAADF
jgi:glyoxylase-like metal-dependent hydrolase (beta-lactamase superfamily II)